MKALKWEDLTTIQQTLLYAIETRLKLELARRVPVKNLYVRPDMFRHFEDIVKRQFNEDEIAAGMNDYTFMHVHIKKGAITQFEAFELDTWAATKKEQMKQREELKMWN
jgi:hypothetical protein